MRFLALLVLSCVTSFWQPALAASGDWYQVELLVFAQTRPEAGETWDATLVPHYDPLAIQLSAGTPKLPETADTATRQAVAAGAWQLRTGNGDLPVASMARKMAASGNYRTLFYGSWQQPLLVNQPVLPIHIEGGRSLTVHPANTSSTPAVTGTEPAGASTPEAPVQTLASLPELQGTVTLSRSQFVHITPNLWFAFPDQGKTVFTSIHESRRLKNGELHYIDNARFGVLVRVLPLK